MPSSILIRAIGAIKAISAIKSISAIRAISLTSLLVFSSSALSQFTFTVYDGTFSQLPNFATLSPIASGTSNEISLSVTTENETFALTFTNQLTVTTPATYEFQTTSDDGSAVYINNSIVVDNDGLHGAQTANGQIFLSAGNYDLRVEFFERNGGEVLDVAYRVAGGIFTPIPSNGELDGFVPGKKELGEWGEVIQWPHVAISTANLPDGRVLTWSSTETNRFPGNREFTHSAVFDPSDQSFLTTDNNFHDMFCAGISTLEDGTIVASGGNPDDSRTSMFNPASLSWAPLTEMFDRRWYATNITLPNNQVFSTFGKSSGNRSEKYDPILDQWTRTPNASMQTLLTEHNAQLSAGGDSQWWPHLSIQPDGTVFQGGPTPTFHVFDPAGGTAAVDLGRPTGDRFRMWGNSVSYDAGKVLLLGGSDRSISPITASANVFLVDMNGPTPTVTAGPPMNFARTLSNSLTLPNGEILVVGGNQEGALFNDNSAVYPAEIYSPVTNSWRIVDSITIPRTYHSTATLLKDGRVLSAGGGACGDGCAANHLDGQIFSPPYLFNADGSDATRPTLSNVPAQAGAANVITVNASSDAQTFSMIRLAGHTHHMNTDHRFVPVSAEAIGNGQFRLTLHENTNVLIPGNYWLFAINSDGTPSIGETIQIRQDLATNPGLDSDGDGIPDDVDVFPNDPTEWADSDSDGTGDNADAFPNDPSETQDSDGDGVGDNADAFPNDPTETKDTDGDGIGDNSDPTPGTGSSIEGLVASWLFNEGSGNTIEDSSPNDHVLTASNMTWGTGVHEQAGQFNGVNAFASAGQPLVDSASDFTVSAWVKLDSLTGWRTFINQDGNNISGFWLQYSEFVSNGKFTLTMHSRDRSSSTAYRAVSTTAPVVGQWYHLVGVRDNANNLIKLYVNGQLEAQTVYSGGWTSNGPLNIGRGKWFRANDWVPGAIDGVAIFDRAIDDNDVSILFNANAQFTGATDTTTDSDGDGTPDYIDAFPNDPNETTDSDGDGFGDNSDSTPTGGSNIVALPQSPLNSSTLIIETSSGADRIWNVNPDNNSVAVSNTEGALIQEIAVGNKPWSLAKAPNSNSIFVTNKNDATISVINSQTLLIEETITLPYASQPHGIVFDQLGVNFYVALEASAKVQQFNSQTRTLVGEVQLSGAPRHLAMNFASSRLYATNFITPPAPGESTASVSIANSNAEMFAIDPSNMTLAKTIPLAYDSRQISESQGPGLPNYLNAPVISFDDSTAFIPSKKDNIAAGLLRGNPGMTFDQTVRANTSRVDLVAETELPNRIDFDNASVATGAALTGDSRYLLVALETSRELVIYDTQDGAELVRLPTGRAPQGVAISSDGTIAYAHNFMDRSISRFDLTEMIETELPAINTLQNIAVVGNETLSTEVFVGKQFFYDAADDRLARDNYMSCASCHNDGGEDGRVWDFTGIGEGLRNTIALTGRAATGEGFMHWSANFDELQDFEGQIRSFAGGSGLMSDTQFNSGSRSEPLGDSKSGVSADLDALAAYIESLNTFSASPKRNQDSSLTPAAVAGRDIFAFNNCASCHTGTSFTNSLDASTLADIGTLKPSSGSRLGSILIGIDVPTLRDVWRTAPYLHDGSAATLAEAVSAHSSVDISGTDLSNLTAYLEQIGSEESSAPEYTEPPVDTDGDGIVDSEDVFPNDPSEWADTDGDGVGNNADAFPNDPTESVDSDGDGVGNNADAFPNDPTESVDSDGDGVGNNADAFPNDPTESVDSDGDGVGNNADAFPNDPTESVDSDGDGVGNNADAFPNDPTESVDSDGDGVGNNADAFPNDPTESVDSDGDGVGNNADAFPNDPTESLDSDSDGVGNNADAFPNDPTESVDSDGDGVGDNADAFPNDPTETKDSDGDGIGDNSDPTPGTTIQGLVASWLFDAGTGNTITDVSSNGANLTASNMTWAPGISGQAGQFNGSNAFATAGQPMLDTAGDFTVSAWVKLDALTGWRTFINQDGNNISGFWLQYSEFVEGGKFSLTMHSRDRSSSTAYRAVSTTTPVVGQWYHLVGVRDKQNNTMKLYVNGQLEGSTAYSGGWTSNGALNIGRGKWFRANDWVPGGIDGVAIFDRAIDDNDVNILYNANAQFGNQ